MLYPKVYIVLVNYNTWEDTIECIESLKKIDYPNYQIIVVDNNSPNDSIKFLKEFFEGKLEVWISPYNPLRKYIFPPSQKPFKYVFMEENDIKKKSKFEDEDVDQIILIKANKNKGFAAGNNIAIKYALKKDDFEYIWILNPDTIVDKNSLKELIRCSKEDDSIGLIGSKLMEYYSPDKIQSLGGLYNPLIASMKYPTSRKEINDTDTNTYIYYPQGASMLVKKDFIKDVGLMCEDYFIYFEEIDWVIRGMQKNWKASYCESSVVYHKEGASIGSNKISTNRSDLSEFFFHRNRIIFTKKFFKNFIPLVYLSFLGVIFNRIKRKDFKKIKIILKAIFNSIRR
jgi:GT2 family glycosyltransferase